MLYNCVVIIAGLLSSLILFSKFPYLKKSISSESKYKISVVIPARNEEKNIELLLNDLMKQTINIHEIICVDDCSTDQTNKVVSSFNVNVISVIDKPKEWTGKSWACQVGGKAATGNLLLFLDADVRLSKDAVSKLLDTYDDNKCVISVQPYHSTFRFYEQFSFIFNIIQLAANSMCLSTSHESVGLYGPVILIDRNTYDVIGCHEAAKTSIVDDLALGERLKQMNFPFKLFMGGKDISFRMYSDSFKSLFLGWTKNYATGAVKTKFSVVAIVVLWITSITLTGIYFGQSIIQLNPINILISSIFYCIWIIELFRISPKIGKYRKTTIVCFPLFTIFFIFVFMISLFKKIFGKNVIWKGRKIRLTK